MILLDTSVWVDHLRRGDSLVVQVLEAGQAAAHAFVIGELACGNLKSRVRVIDLLRALPQLAMAMDDEVLYFIERHKLMGRGIGYVDAHLLASSSISGSLLWTRDKRKRSPSGVLVRRRGARSRNAAVDGRSAASTAAA